MADRPIIFSAPMVCALLDGRKTQTRRMVDKGLPAEARYTGIHHAGDERDSWFFNSPVGPRKVPVRYEEGDRLYVREAWNGEQYAVEDAGPGYTGTQPYAADFVGTPMLKWKPSIHMPRLASRLTLHVEAVKVERLQEISEADAIAEGVHRIGDEFGAGQRPTSFDDGPNRYTVDIDAAGLNAPTAVDTFRLLWEHLHGTESWDANPFVVALTFRVELGNIDRLAA